MSKMRVLGLKNCLVLKEGNNNALDIGENIILSKLWVHNKLEHSSILRVALECFLCI